MRVVVLGSTDLDNALVSSVRNVAYRAPEELLKDNFHTGGGYYKANVYLNGISN